MKTQQEKPKDHIDPSTENPPPETKPEPQHDPEREQDTIVATEDSDRTIQEPQHDPERDQDTALKRESFEDRLVELIGGRIIDVRIHGVNKGIHGLHIQLERSQANPVHVVAWIHQNPNEDVEGYLEIEEITHG